MLMQEWRPSKDVRHANLRHVRVAQHVFATIDSVITGVLVLEILNFVRFFETPVTRQQTETRPDPLH